MSRIGIYGGTFAPPHNGHVSAAKAFVENARLDHLYVVPAYVPPHKELHFRDDPAVRLRMARAAFEGEDPRITVSDEEIRRGGVSYTADTLARMAGKTGGELFFLCGTDMFLSMDTWRRPEEIFRLACIACAPRFSEPQSYALVKNKAADYATRYGARTLLLEIPPLPVSSSEIRARLAAGNDISSLVPPGVAEIIREEGLYHD